MRQAFLCFKRLFKRIAAKDKFPLYLYKSYTYKLKEKFEKAVAEMRYKILRYAVMFANGNLAEVKADKKKHPKAKRVLLVKGL